MPFSVRKDSLSPSPRSRRIVFDNFEVDLRAGEVRKNGTRIRLQAQPFQLLALLLFNAGEVVTRDEICRDLWPANTFVDFEHSLAAAVNKIREALCDSADNPRYIETLPKRGYRFIGKIAPELPMVVPVPDAQESVELVPVPAAKTWSTLNWRLGLGIVAVTVAAAAVAFVWLPREPDDSKPLVIAPFTSYPGLETAPSFSPDGSRIAFSWANGTNNRSGRPGYDLYVKSIGSETVLRLTNHAADWISSTWSPDGTQIAFHRLAADDNGIYLVPALGGPERKLLATHTPYDLAAPLSWSPDGKWIAYSDTANGVPGNRTFLLNAETLESHELPHGQSCRHEGWLTFSHDGQELAMVCVHNTTSYEYLVTDLQGKSKRSLTTLAEPLSGPLWTGDDKSLILAGVTAKGNEFAEVRVRDGQVHKLSFATGNWPAISKDGRKLAFSVSDNHVNIWRKDLQHPGAPAVQMYISTRQQKNCQYSPDGKHVAFDTTRSGTWSVWLADTDGSNLIQISQTGIAGYPRWSPDSRKIAFEMTGPSGHLGVYTVDISDRVPTKLKTNIRESSHPFWSHDGKWIYFRGYEGVGRQLYRCPAGGGAATLLAASEDLRIPIESPDSKVLYFPWRNDDANMMMLALDRPDGTPQQVPDMPKISSEAQWAVVPDGIYFSPLNNPRSICFYDFATRHTREIFRTDKDLAEGMSISPDRRYMLYSQIDESNSDIMLVSNFR
jgi:Tol biopolymer transport system component/DNA-binding winged helix-turn-helix (wHTH) protein